MITIGELATRLMIEQPVATDDGAGGQDTTWQPLAAVWVHMKAVPARERLYGDGLKPRVSHKLTMRHRADVRADMRFSLGLRRFEIRALADPDNTGKWLVCLVDEHF